MQFGESAAFVRSDDPRLFPGTEFPDKLVDSTSAADSPDLELFSTPFAYKVDLYVVLIILTLLISYTGSRTGILRCSYIRPACLFITVGDTVMKSCLK